MSASQSLKEFLKHRKESDQGAAGIIDWEARKSERIQAIRSIFADIERWLGPAIAEGVVTVSREPCELSEGHIGSFISETLVIEIGSLRVQFRPVGANVAGASGRIDVTAGRHSLTMVHFPDRGWHFLVRDHAVRTVPINEDSFSDALKELLEE